MIIALLLLAAGVAVPADMASIPAGRYRPLYSLAGAAWAGVRPFAIDRDAVTRGQFLSFVRAHDAWRRSTIRPLFADHDYLAEWPGELLAGEDAALRTPVTSVSWFAARAYCSSLHKRLPTTDEWEYVARANETIADATGDPAFRQRLLALYSLRGTDRSPRGFRNVYGVRDLHGVNWEWTDDFNSVLVPDDSRQGGSGVGTRHTLFCASAAIGASDPSDYPAFLRYAFRAGLTGRSTVRSLGFRCATGVAAA